MKKLYALILLALVALTGCEKSEFDDTPNGEALGTFQTKLPDNNAILVLNSALPAEKVIISWNASAPGLSIQPTYSFQAITESGNFDAPFLSIISDNYGKNPQLSFTQQEWDTILKNKGLAEGARITLKWRIIAQNGSDTEATEVKTITVTRMGDGVSNFVLYGPLSSTTPITTNPNSSTDFINFKWEAAKAGKAANPVTYKVKFVNTGGNFNTPLFEVNSDGSGSSASLALSYKRMDELLKAAGLTVQSVPANLQWTVEATSGSFKKTADYVNEISILREVKLYLVGGSTPAGWNPSQATPMIEDKNQPGLFYTYVYLTVAGDGLKFLGENTDWGTPTQKIYGRGSGDGILLQDGGSGNISVPANGYYRVSADLVNNRYYVQARVMGAVGAATPAGWDPGSVFPGQGLHLIETNKFLGFVNLTAGAEWKFIDGNAWGDGTASGSKDFGKVKNVGQGPITQGDADNMTVPGATGRYRLIWDGTDVKNLKYQITRGTAFLIGSATAAGWDNSPGNASIPEMTWMGDGKWTVTANLSAGEFKFIVEKGNWDYSYGPGTAAGTIVNGGGNMSVATSGSYTITLDEYNRTYTVVKN